MATFTDFDLQSNSPGAPDLSLADGIYLTTGLGQFDTTTNTSNSASASTGTGDFQPLVDLANEGSLSTFQNDSNVLSFSFTLDDQSQNAVSAQFIFASDEFPTQGVTDIMGIFVNGENFAFFPNGDLVSNQSGDPNEFFNDNSVGLDTYGIEWNGLTNAFNVNAPVNGNGAVNTIEFAIADTSDSIFDSALFVTGLTAGVTDDDNVGIVDEPVVVGPITPVTPVTPVTPMDPAVAPVPLPAAGWLLIGAHGGLAAMRRRS